MRLVQVTIGQSGQSQMKAVSSFRGSKAGLVQRSDLVIFNAVEAALRLLKLSPKIGRKRHVTLQSNENLWNCVTD